MSLIEGYQQHKSFGLGRAFLSKSCFQSFTYQGVYQGPNAFFTDNDIITWFYKILAA